MSATSNKSRVFLLLMIAISLVFFMVSFVAAAFSGNPGPTSSASVDSSSSSSSTPVQDGTDATSAPAAADTPANAALGEAGCTTVRTGEQVLADCSP